MQLKAMLADAGYSPILLAASAEEAFARLEEEPDISLVLLDAIMPGVDGLNACGRIKAQRPDLPVIIVTPVTGEVDPEAAFAAGASDYVAKPLRKIEVLARLRAALRLKHAMDARADLARRLESMNHELERLSSQDALTGLANRRHFDVVLESEWRRGARNADPLAAIMVDIDLFKALNDYCGHPAGDVALREVSAVLRSAVLRPADLVARYGGDEFVLLLPNTSVLGAELVAERLRGQVEALAIPHPRAGGALTISLGVAGVLPDLAFSPSCVIAAADQALYTAKRSGRNCVARWEGAIPSMVTAGPALRKVVVVDDDHDTCDALGDALGDHGYVVRFVSNGLKLVGTLAMDRPDVILLDVTMSWINGFDLCVAIKQNVDFRSIPVVFISGRTAAEDVRHGLSCGAEDYLTKPIDLDHLLTRLDVLLSAPS
jgi:diguanylate cyclase (GGDEF)-like protein